METKQKIAALSILANAVLSGAKISVGVLSNSSAIIAEGVHSFVDIFSSAIGYLGIKISQKPVDKKHPYGYYKFEVLSGAAITLILLATGIGIVYEAFQGLLLPKKIEIGYLAFGIMFFSAAVNEAMARLKIYFGKKENSLSLLSDGIHSRVDVYASLAVLGGLLLAGYWIYADAFLALLIGFYIIKESFSLGKEAVDSLLDVSAGEEIEKKIEDIARLSHIEIGSLKTQKKGSAVTASMEIKLPSSLKVQEAVDISENLRKKLMEEVKNLSYVEIQIKSHETETRFFRPSFGRGLGWQRRGKFAKEEENAEAKGPGGYCVCPKCGYRGSHLRGTPCADLKCPECGANLKRE